VKKIDYKLLIISVGISAGLVLFVIGMSTGLSGRDATNLPEAIEQISPGQGDQVLQQTQIIVDFIEGYTATLTIDGIELPTTRLDEVVATGKQIAPGAQVDLPPTAIFDVGSHRVSTQAVFVIGSSKMAKTHRAHIPGPSSSTDSSIVIE
jgi:hypothetical protein